MVINRTIKSIAINLGIIIFIIIITIIGFFYIYLPLVTKHGESITVPDLEGMSMEEAQTFLTKRNLRLEVFDSTFIPGIEPMTIISQNPSPMVNVKENRKIYITVTPRYAPKVLFPDVIDISFQMVEKILRNNGLVLGKIQYRPDLAQNAVLETLLNGIRIKPGDSVYKGSTIDIVVGDGRGSDRFLVPKLEGLSLEDAEYIILGSGLQIGLIEYEENDEIELGQIIRTKPSHANGDIIRIGDVINLWVSGNNVQNETFSEDSLLEDL